MGVLMISFVKETLRGFVMTGIGAPLKAWENHVHQILYAKLANTDVTNFFNVFSEDQKLAAPAVNINLSLV
jgi:hypothetical protein